MAQRDADWRRRILELWVAALGGMVCSNPASAVEGSFVGSQSCNSVSCHGRVEPRRLAAGSSGASLHEFPLYQRHDPHAQAAKTLVSAEFSDIMDRLTKGQDSLTRGQVYRRCAQCHDPEGIAQGAEQSAASRGISCESCHGGAKGWLTRHYERDASPSSLIESGMRDTKNLQVRAELCASCHVGGEGKDVNHDLLAAGHPPLRFELAAYHRQLTSHDESGKQSHWNDARERISTKDFEIKLWEAGQIATAKAALNLLESRAHRAALHETDELRKGASWPEFAEYDCFSCHQRLRPADIRQLARGLPEWKPWSLAWLETSGGTAELSELRARMGTAFAAEPNALAPQVKLARQSLPATLLQPEATSSQLLSLLVQPGKNDNSWEALCQRYLAQRAVEKALGDEFQKLRLAGQTAAVDKTAFDRERNSIDRELSAIAKELAFADRKSEWPKLLANPEGIKQVESALTTAAGRLRKLQSHVEPGR